MNKIYLKDGFNVVLEDGSSLSNIVVRFRDRESIIAVWDRFTNENLKSVQITTEDNLVIGAYENLTLESVTCTDTKDGKTLASFKLREKTELELLKEEMAAMKEEQEIHSGAISDLGEVVSIMAEQQEVTA